jgi:hypothetical protein
MEGRLGHDQAVRQAAPADKTSKKRLLLLALMALAGGSAPPASAQVFAEPPIRYGVTSSFYYDGRGDNRDFPTNGVFPGNFAADPIDAAIGGAAGFLEINPRRSPAPYPSQTYVAPVRNPIYCQRHPASRFRSSHHCAASSSANFGILGTPVSRF